MISNYECFLNVFHFIIESNFICLRFKNSCWQLIAIFPLLKVSDECPMELVQVH